MNISIPSFLISLVLFVCFSCQKESGSPLVQEKPLLKGWYHSSTHKVWIEEIQEYAKGSFLNVINFKNDSCFVVVDVEFQLYSDTTHKWLAQYNLKAPVETIGQFTKIGKYIPEGYPEYLYLPDSISIIDSTRGDSLYFCPTIVWTQLSGTVSEVQGSTFYSKYDDWYHRIYQFSNDSLIAYLYKEYSTEIPTSNWSEIIKLPVIYSEDSYQIIWYDTIIQADPTVFIFYEDLWITSYNDLSMRLLMEPYIKK